MANWPANGDLNWNSAMLTYLAVEHNTDGTHKDLTYENLVVDDIKTKSPWVDVTHPDFGADPTGEVDSSTAIQAALDSLTDETGTLFFSPGTYLCNNLVIDTTDTEAEPKVLHILGYGATLKNTHASNRTIRATLSNPDRRTGLVIEGLHFDGQANTTTAIEATYCPLIKIFNCSFYNHRNTAIYLTSCWNGIVQNCLAKGGPSDTRIGTGYRYFSGGGNFKFINCKAIDYNTGIKVSDGPATGGLITGCDFSYLLYGIIVEKGIGMVISGNYMEWIEERAMAIGTHADGVHGINILGNRITGMRVNGKPNCVGIRLDYADNVVIKGNYSSNFKTFIPITANATVRLKDITPNWSADTTYSDIIIPSLANDGTPSVAGSDDWLTGGTEIIVDFGGGIPSQAITIISKHATPFAFGLSGNHDGGNNEATVMTDSGESFVIDSLIGLTIINVTDGSSGVIIDNDATTVTVAALTGGTDNDWDAGDAWTIDTHLEGSSANIITAIGDITKWLCEDGTIWRLTAFVDASADNSGGA